MFSLFVGTHSRLIGLGGIDRSVRVLMEALAAGKEKKRQSLRCTCGAAAVECRYWGEVARRIPSHDVSNRRAQYTVALDAFAAGFGDDAWPVDSSKHVESLDELSKIIGLDVRVVHLIKDVRSLSTSFIDQARSKKGVTRPGTLLAIEYFWRWRRENGKIDACVARNHLPVQRVGYEEVCLAPDVVMGVIHNFLGVPKESCSLAFETSQSHLIAGNRMLNQEEKQTLRYDHRWFARNDWLAAAFLFPQILRYNSQAVYSNDAGAMWTR